MCVCVCVYMCVYIYIYIYIYIYMNKLGLSSDFFFLMLYFYWKCYIKSNIYIYIFSRRFYPKRLTVHSGYTFSLVHVFPGNRTQNLLRSWRNALPLSHTGTQCWCRFRSQHLLQPPGFEPTIYRVQGLRLNRVSYSDAIYLYFFITTKYQMLYFLSKHIDQWLDVESVWYIGLSLV